MYYLISTKELHFKITLENYGLCLIFFFPPFLMILIASRAGNPILQSILFLSHSRFDFSAIGNKEGEQKIIAQQERDQIVTKLHQILRPFLLRRVKTDVELELPKKAVMTT